MSPDPRHFGGGSSHSPGRLLRYGVSHRGQPDIAQSFALPRRFKDAGVRRYGFHGLSYEYLASRLRDLHPELASKRVIMAHLGNGASLCATQHGQCVASTMGFTALDGLMMGTRCGALDPGVILYLMQEHHMDAAAIRSAALSGNRDCSGCPAYRLTCARCGHRRIRIAREAIALFVYRIVREIGSLVAALDGIDAIVFSGGIGENDAATRTEVIEGCRWMGAVLDPQLNARGEGCGVSTATSRVAVWVIPTDEERLIASHTIRALG